MKLKHPFLETHSATTERLKKDTLKQLAARTEIFGAKYLPVRNNLSLLQVRPAIFLCRSTSVGTRAKALKLFSLAVGGFIDLLVDT